MKWKKIYKNKLYQCLTAKEKKKKMYKIIIDIQIIINY